jgi:DNA-binding transcriptional ArsR family regulator
VPAEVRKQITDVRALRALASPIRQRILGHLMATGAQTASECAAVVGATASNCSYHLRELERFGLVERIEGPPGRDGRDRPWRPAATGFSYGPRDDEEQEPVGRLASRRLVHTGIDETAALVHEAVDAHDLLPPEWRRAEVLSTFNLLVTADELVALSTAVDAILRPYIGLTRDDAPAEAKAVHVVFDAVRRPGTRAAR